MEIWTVVAVYSGELVHVSVWNSEDKAEEQAKILRKNYYFIDIDSHILDNEHPATG